MKEETKTMGSFLLCSGVVTGEDRNLIREIEVKERF